MYPLSEAITCAVSARRTPEKSHAFTGEIVPIRHLLAQGDDAVALYDDHTFFARLFHGCRPSAGNSHRARPPDGEGFPVKQHIRIHDDHIVGQRLSAIHRTEMLPR